MFRQGNGFTEYSIQELVTHLGSRINVMTFIELVQLCLSDTQFRCQNFRHPGKQPDAIGKRLYRYQAEPDAMQDIDN